MEEDNEPQRIYEDLVSQVAPLTPEREVQLAATIQAGGPDADAATKELVEANLGLVIEIAKSYQAANLPILDLVQQGNDGLIEAVRVFVPAQGSRFAAFAAAFVHRSLDTLPELAPSRFAHMQD